MKTLTSTILFIAAVLATFLLNTACTMQGPSITGRVYDITDRHTDNAIILAERHSHIDWYEQLKQDGIFGAIILPTPHADNLTQEHLDMLADLVTEKMLASGVIQKTKKKPIIIIATPEHVPCDADIMREDLQDEIIARMLDAGVAWIFNEAHVSCRYDYIVRITLSKKIVTDPTQQGDYFGTTPPVLYNCILRLSSPSGKQLGQWQSTIQLVTRLSNEDFVSLAGLTTEKMLASDVIRNWHQRPRIIVAVPENTTHKTDLRPEDLQDEIIARMLNAGVARIVDEASVSFRYDYIVKTVLSNTRQPGAERKKITATPRIIYYTCTQSLLSRRGEQLGRWHSTIQVMGKQTTAPQ